MIHAMARLGTFINFIRMDPLFVPRFLLYRLHPRAMLPTTTHLRRLFFSSQYPNDKLEDFNQYLPESESMVWVLGLIVKFADFRIMVERSITGLGGSKPDGERILILVGEQDVLMDVRMMRRLATRYRDAVKQLVLSENSQGRVGSDEDNEAADTETYTENRGNGVRTVVVKGAGHHVQNDLQWEVGAQRIADFLQQL